MAIAEDGGERPDADAMDGERERERTGADGQWDRSELGPAAAAAGAADVSLFLPGAPRLAS